MDSTVFGSCSTTTSPRAMPSRFSSPASASTRRRNSPQPSASGCPVVKDCRFAGSSSAMAPGSTAAACSNSCQVVVSPHHPSER
jgi:hypothetical protein